MNAIVPVKFDPSVSAYLQRPELMRVAQQAVAGINAFSAPNRVSIRAGRFHYVDTEGVETDVQENNGVALDVIVLDANPVVSKLYYEGAYNPGATEPVAPTCFSDNGIGPSDRSTAPQAATCAVCPHGVWGSKVTPTGSKVKACADIKKIAVVPASNPTGAVYGLNIPAASLKPWSSFVAMLTERGVPLSAMVVRFGFDTTASYPKLTYKPLRWVDEGASNAVAALIGSGETQAIVGATDKPRMIDTPPLPNRPAPDLGPTPTINYVPTVMRPASPNPSPLAPPIADLPAHTQAALAEAPRRTRRTKAEMEAARAQPEQKQAAAPAADDLDIPEFLQRQTNGPAPKAGAAPVVQPASAELDAMLDGIMGKK